MYTAAFSGKPGGALLSHTACILQSLVMAKVQDIDRDYVYLNCGPLFHIATFMTTLAVFQWGGTNVFTPRVEAEELCRLIEAEKCTGAFVMGPTLTQIVEVNKDGRFDLKSLRSLPRHAGLERDDDARHQRVGPPPGRLRPDRVHGHAHAQRARRGREGQQRPADAAGAGAHRRSRGHARCPPARPARSSPAAPPS